MHKEFKIENRIRLLTEKYSPFTNVVGLSRSLLALGLLLTLLTTDINTLVHKYKDGNLVNPLLNESVALNKYNFFILFIISHRHSASRLTQTSTRWSAIVSGAPSTLTSSTYAPSPVSAVVTNVSAKISS